MKEDEKICPLQQDKHEFIPCQKEKCALWIQIQKDFDGNPFDYKMVYNGCGLINHIPWRIVEKKKNGEKET